MLLDQKKTKRMVRAVSILAALGVVGALVIVLGIVISQGGAKSAADLRRDEINAARKAVQQTPGDPAAWDNLAQALLTDDPAGAVDPARRAVRLTPRNFDRVETLAIALDTSGNTEGAIAEVQRYTAKNPKNPDGLLLLGQLAEKAARTPLAQLSYTAVLALDPSGASITSQEAQTRLDAINGTKTPTTGTTSTPTPTTPSRTTTKPTTPTSTGTSTGPVTP
jgi:cytochrome c-type biogenesis protein CcmH/NrfG